jgi:DNA-binding transcriptional ArsR family regulator
MSSHLRLAPALREQPLPEPVARDVATLFALLGDPTRVRLLHALAVGEAVRVSDLAKAVERDPSTISHQLRVLRDYQLVTGERRGRVVLYRLADSHVLTLFQQALAHAAHQPPLHLPGGNKAAQEVG